MDTQRAALDKAAVTPRVRASIWALIGMNSNMPGVKISRTGLGRIAAQRPCYTGQTGMGSGEAKTLARSRFHRWAASWGSESQLYPLDSPQPLYSLFSCVSL